jgi:hypothetical protein
MTVAKAIRRSMLNVPASLLALVLTLASAWPAQALEALRPSLKELSEKVARFLEGREENTIAVGAFTGPASSLASAGPGIKLMLIEELLRQKVKGQPIRVTKDARLEIKGDYRSVLDDQSHLLALRLQAELLDSQGDAVVKLDKKIEDRDVLAQVLGITKPDFGSGLTPQKESEALKKRISKPETEVRGTRIQANPGSRYAIEILVKSGGKWEALQPTEDGGQAFVDIKPGQVFAVRLINESEFDAAVELRLDGLSMFAFTENKNYRHVIVGAKKSSLIKGWHRTNEVSDEFEIGDYSRSAVKELLANSDNIGTITAAFAAAWDPNGEKPADEGAKFRDPFNPAVVRGKPVKAPYQEIVRESGRVRDIISVRYKKPSR